MYTGTESFARRSERHEIVLPVRLQLTRDASTRVRFRSSVQAPDALIEGDLIDLSRGGVGFMASRFIPKGASLNFRVCGLDADPTRPILVARVRVQRVRMTDSRPAYLIGGAFIDSDAVFEHDLDLLLNRLRTTEPSAEPDPAEADAQSDAHTNPEAA